MKNVFATSVFYLSIGAFSLQGFADDTITEMDTVQNNDSAYSSGTENITEDNNDDIHIVETPIAKKNDYIIKKKPSFTQAELKSAYSVAKTGAALHGVGMGIQVVGVVTLISELSQNPYRFPVAGVSLSLIGGATAFAGPIVSGVGGNKAKGIIHATGKSASRFKGWSYFGAGIGCAVSSSMLSIAEVPGIPTILSIVGEGFYIASIANSVRFTRSAIFNSNAGTISFVPYAHLGANKSVGAGITAFLQ